MVAVVRTKNIKRFENKEHGHNKLAHARCMYISIPVFFILFWFLRETLSRASWINFFHEINCTEELFWCYACPSCQGFSRIICCSALFFEVKLQIIELFNEKNDYGHVAYQFTISITSQFIAEKRLVAFVIFVVRLCVITYLLSWFDCFFLLIFILGK